MGLVFDFFLRGGSFAQLGATTGWALTTAGVLTSKRSAGATQGKIDILDRALSFLVKQSAFIIHRPEEAVIGALRSPFVIVPDDRNPHSRLSSNPSEGGIQSVISE